MIWRLFALFALIALPLRAEIAIQEVTSPGGIKAWLVEEHGIPFTALEIRFQGGTATDFIERKGERVGGAGLGHGQAVDLSWAGGHHHKQVIRAPTGNIMIEGF